MILPSTTTGCAPPAVQRPVLHPWLQSAAPLGRVRQFTTVSTGCAAPAVQRPVLHPWLQSAAPVGRVRQFTNAPTMPFPVLVPAVTMVDVGARGL